MCVSIYMYIYCTFEKLYVLICMYHKVHWLTTSQRREKLRTCPSCPFSACGVCTKQQESQGTFVFDVLKRESGGSKCANCVSKDPMLLLAKVLEVAWTAMCSSRLAVPFLRPMLPVHDDGLSLSYTYKQALSLKYG